METAIKITFSPDKLEAYLDYDPHKAEEGLTEEDIRRALTEKNFPPDSVEDIVRLVLKPDAKFPVIIVRGKQPVPGKDGYLEWEKSDQELDEKHEDNAKVNLREVRKIQSVKNGDKIARIIPPAPGEDGCDVFGNPIPAAKGKPVILKKGKHTRVLNDIVYALADGQLSLGKNVIHVLPTFEVQGNLDLKTGNIDFIGNVTINGDVPSGYSIKAGGDITVNGLVEGSRLEAGGSITISGGVLGAGEGKLIAGESVSAAFLNHAEVTAEHSISIKNFILQSFCRAGESIICHKGYVVGGKLQAGTLIQVVDAGTDAQTKTVLEIESHNELLEHHHSLTKQIQEAKQTLGKVNQLALALSHKFRQKGSLSEKEVELLKREKATEAELGKSLKDLENKLLEVEADLEAFEQASIKISGTAHPNTTVTIGRYHRLLRQTHHRIQIRLNKKLELEIAYL